MIRHIIVILSFWSGTIGLSQNWSFEPSVGYQINQEGLYGESGTGGPCGHCTSKIEKPQNMIFGNQIYVSFSGIKERFNGILTFGYSEWNLKYNGIIQTYNHDHQVGPKVALTTRKFNYSSNESYLNVALGLGYNLLDPENKFSICPTLKFNPEFFIRKKILSDEVNYTYEHYVYDSIWYKTKSNSEDYMGFGGVSGFSSFWRSIKSSNPSLSLRIGFRPTEKIKILFEAGYQLRLYTRYSIASWGYKSNGMFSALQVGFIL